MALPIFFIAENTDEQFITLSEETSKHVVQVLRMKQGEQLNLADGKGNLLLAEITDDHKKKCTVRILDKKHEVRKAKKVCIAISLLKNANRFEWFLEKATEIGVSEIIPLVCERTEKHQFKFDRMQNILIAAMLQSQQYWLPILHEATLFSNAIVTSEYEEKYIAHCEDEAKQAIAKNEMHVSRQIFIGPEGDFSKHEIATAISSGFYPVTLGNTRLRTETAGIVAATLLTH